ncbi:hypothetical protein A5784_02510 [Mycobacterium sp. 852013-50091_SCH5140682]|uniref:hypothetical protein n=1 Tax=Mycobacterium sp. 852013-50091_SCH5140682 TaxID=1834109 RepID=UPI0007EA36AF|nr:hypothetical protein [Mycobacterium sp. 852013-50091_SCH5140682]OBC01100.1 hypothetical protein A5784_02510 [Mycobacterium sp. 852013-50091_SCH5140682]
MPANKNIRRTATVAGVVAVIVIGGAVAWFWYWHIIDSRNPYGGHNSYGMRDYTPAMQEKAAGAIVSALNTRNPDNVDLLRFHGHPENDVTNKTITENITAVLPPPGCQYALVSVEDKGDQEHPATLVPWYAKAVEHARAFDMQLQQLCPGQQSTPRTIRVIAIPSGMGGYWAEAALEKRD